MSAGGRTVAPVSMHESSEVADYIFSFASFGSFDGEDSWDF